jgi:hypothetical protein
LKSPIVKWEGQVFGSACGRHGSQNQKRGDDMGVSEAVEIIWHLMGGLGLFFMGVGVLWFVTVYKDKA